MSAYPVAAVTALAPCPCWRQRHCPSVPDPTLALSSALCHSDHMSQALATWRLGWFGQQEPLPSQGREKPGDYSPRPHLCVSCGIPNRTMSGLWVAPSQVGPPHPPPEGGSSFLLSLGTGCLAFLRVASQPSPLYVINSLYCILSS